MSTLSTNMQGKICMVTGANSGIGKATSLGLGLIFSSLGISPEEGAKTSIYLASSPDVEGVTGKYFAKSIPRRSAPISYDESLQRQLWEESHQGAMNCAPTPAAPRPVCDRVAPVSSVHAQVW